MKLAPGVFLGLPMRKRSVAGAVFAEYRYRPATNLVQHSHELGYFSFVLSGSYDERFSTARENHCTSEVALYHPAGEQHSDRFGVRGGHLFSIEISAECLRRAEEYELIVDKRIVFRRPEAEILKRRAFTAFSDPRPVSALILQSVVSELLYQLPWKYSVAPESSSPQWLMRAIEILHAEFREPLRLTSIAERVGTHPVHLARTFRRHRGVTIGNYIRRLRIEHAVEALSRNKGSLAEIACEAGFCDQSHFGRTFKAAVGMTPQQFRSLGANHILSGRKLLYEHLSTSHT